MWTSRTKSDLIIEVWEKLDCESVGAVEIEAIEIAVADRFGASAVESPMAIARQLADEGAELRHAEILTLFVQRLTPVQDELINEIELDFSSLDSALVSVRRADAERQTFVANADTERQKRLRERILDAKNRAVDGTRNPKVAAGRRAELGEIAEWLTIWLQTPAIFANWLDLRTNSRDFKERFGRE